MSDQIIIETPNDLGASNTSTGSLTTNAQGQWTDYYTICSPVCWASTGKTVATQHWYLNGVVLPGPTSVEYKCDGITINGH
jgi:hypothetical protein